MADYNKKPKKEEKSWEDETLKEETTPEPEQTPQPQKTITNKYNPKKSYKIVLVGKNYIVVSENGNGRFIEGAFPDKKIGDTIELDL